MYLICYAEQMRSDHGWLLAVMDNEPLFSSHDIARDYAAGMAGPQKYGVVLVDDLPAVMQDGLPKWDTT